MPTKSYNQILDEHLHILVAQGNHEAFNQLRKRYHKHAINLSNELLRQYRDTGITRKELVSVCEDHFIFVLNKFVSGLSSFFTFWKESTQQTLMDYIIENSYDGDAFSFRGSFSIDQNFDDKHPYSEYVAEIGDERKIKRKILELRQILNKYEVFFTFKEKAILNLIFEGYSLAELEHGGVLTKSDIYLTYKSAVEKLRFYTKKSI